MLHLKFDRKPQGKFVITVKIKCLLTSGRIFEEFIEKRIIPLKKKYPYADIYIEVYG
ncbi:MAG: hypothetical protein K2G55_21695 [Lachnospiraceae bacterium]|nr:hypothetical protein [Lachnospiraceae bacterium]MDE7202598.1 hypothetical protein [Lachnospiraceae bacterium]